MSKRWDDLHFESKIHEYMEPMMGNCKGLRSIVDHYGYVYENEETRIQHSNRNISLLKKYLEDTPTDIRMTGQLVQEYVSIGAFDEAVLLCHVGIKNAGNETKNVFLFSK